MRITDYQVASLEEVKNGIDYALNDFRRNDLQLLKLCADERAATHRIACYLQQYFLNWNVDCEYNRRGKYPKEQNGRLIRPDIIVHHRGISENLLCIEAKKEGESLEEDKMKLKKFTDPTGEDKYQFGLLLILSLKVPYTINCEWFRDGNAI